jgi:quercetin dioxygenase-like cupin family protein
MSGLRTIIGTLSVGMIIFGSFPERIAAAQDQPIKRTELHRSDLADVVGKEAVIYMADVMPGAKGGRHTHYGDEYVYVLEGTLVITPDGQQPITLRKGDVAHIAPKDGVHAARNGSSSEPARAGVPRCEERQTLGRTGEIGTHI